MSETLQPRRGDIFMANLTGHTLDSICGERPVIILQNNKGNIHSTSVIAALITGSPKKYLPTHVKLYPEHGLKRPSTALCEHIVTLDKWRLTSYMGTVVNTKAEVELNEALEISLSLAPEGGGGRVGNQKK